MNNCLQLVRIRCGCRRIIEQMTCHEINMTKNYRLPCDELCTELIQNRAITKLNLSLVQAMTEEARSSKQKNNSITKRKSQQDNSVEKTTTVHRNSSTKKSKARRFVWTLNKVILLFGLFTIITVSLIVYMFNEIT